MSVCLSHLRLWNLIVKKMQRTVQSVNMPIQTAIGPIPKRRTRKMHRATRLIHILMLERIIENLTSPAARIPYAGMNDIVQTTGFTTDIQHIM